MGSPRADRATALLEVFGRTADGMVAIDDAMLIAAWNDAAVHLLGFTPDEVLGRPCYEILAWHDRCGNELCDMRCLDYARVARGDFLETRDVMGRTKSGRRVWLSVSTVTAAPEVRSPWRMVHFMREASLPPQLEQMLLDRLVAQRLPQAPPSGMNGGGTDGPSPVEALTLREREVLRLLIEGMDTEDIATRLVVSSATVRNHIQHILSKLGAHSRLEAVALALKHR